MPFSLACEVRNKILITWYYRGNLLGLRDFALLPLPFEKEQPYATIAYCS